MVWIERNLLKQIARDSEIQKTEESKTEKPKAEEAKTDIRDDQVSNEITSKEQFKKVLKIALENFEEKVILNIKDYSQDEYNLKAINEINLENPEINYGYERVVSTMQGLGNSDEKIMTINFHYSQSKEEMIRQKTAVEAKIKEFLKNNIKSDMSSIEKEIAIHDYIVKNAEYNTEGLKSYYPTDHNAYGVLVKGTGVCESYAKAFYVLGKAAGLEVMYVTGVATNSLGSQNHAWNMIKLNDGWYNVDVTWDDPVFSRKEDKWIEIGYEYFNVPDSNMKESHKKNKVVNGNQIVQSEVIVNYPVAMGNQYTYEKLDIIEKDKNGNKFENVKSKSELDIKIKEAIESKRDTLFLKVYNIGMNMNEFLNEVQVVLNNNKSMNKNGLSGSQIVQSGDSIKLIKYTFNYR